ncbi:hypothetical protein GCM10027590_19370 [Nocardiopsis nanhaiensis]
MGTGCRFLWPGPAAACDSRIRLPLGPRPSPTRAGENFFHDPSTGSRAVETSVISANAVKARMETDPDPAGSTASPSGGL